MSLRPNILFIYTDDQSRWSVGAYGNKECLTPNMDRLAREGIMFTHAYTKPVCSPSRAMVLTGQYSHRSGIHDFIEKNILNGLPPETVTVAEELKDAGYATGLIGKWHLGHKAEHFPTNHGFDYFMGFNDGGIKPLNPTLYKDGQYRKMQGHFSNIITDDALEFIRARKDKPFALFFFTRAPHKPYTPVPAEDMAPYLERILTVPEADGATAEKMQQLNRDYYASVTQVDRNIGRLLKELTQLGLEDNTIVVFTSDNGYNVGQHNGLEGKGNGMQIASPLRRPNMWETSVMVPLIVRWPPVIKPGSVSDSLVTLMDLFPTFMDILDWPADGLALDGLSLLPLLQGRKPARWRNALFDAYDMHAYTRYRGSEDSMRMIRTRDWKLVLHLKKANAHELYDLRNDPDELKNLYGTPAVQDIQRGLEIRLYAWMRRNNAETIGQFTEWREGSNP
ncbi:MAG: sulfatase-like hydrolase/transferase [Kiritimatiellales bacterium]|nr:sulfatase-like hydrolase/transferase [Kiritimatiellales bacterium]